MLKNVINLNKRKAKHDEYEYCVICWKKTNVKRNEHIKNRVGYKEGMGQLCYECYKKYGD